jgi:RNA polymerase sigma-70 factor (ECF subfamily)
MNTARRGPTLAAALDSAALPVQPAGRAAMSRPGPPALEAAAPRDPERLAGVVRDNIDFVWRVLRRQGLSSADADDGVQRVFLVFRDKEQGVAPGAEKGFLFRVAHFVAKELRRGVRRFEAPTDENVAAAQSPSQRIEAADLLDKMMCELDDDERAAFTLYEIEGLTMEEIAQLVGCPPGTVASRLRRARGKVREAAARLDAGDGGGA